MIASGGLPVLFLAQKDFSFIMQVEMAKKKHDLSPSDFYAENKTIQLCLERATGLISCHECCRLAVL